MTQGIKIAFYGRSGSGKDFVTSRIIEEYPEFIRISFSDRLKEIASSIFNFLEVDYAPEVKEKPLNITTELGENINLSPRQIWLKMNFLRDIEDTIFIRKTHNLIKEKEEQGYRNFIIPDIRTKAELQYCVDNGFEIIKINCYNRYHPNNSFDDIQDSEEFKEATVRIFNNIIGLDIDKEDIDKILEI